MIAWATAKSATERPVLMMFRTNRALLKQIHRLENEVVIYKDFYAQACAGRLRWKNEALREGDEKLRIKNWLKDEQNLCDLLATFIESLNTKTLSGDQPKAHKIAMKAYKEARHGA